MMKRVRLQHEYHDAALRSVRFADADITLVADLDGHWNKECPERAYLTFHNVKNVQSVREVLSVASGMQVVETTDEIIAVVKMGKTRYLIDLQHAGSLEIDCRGISEI